VITIGVDAHKRVHAAVAVDESEQELARWRGPNTAIGWTEVLRWAQGLGSERRWGIEVPGVQGVALLRWPSRLAKPSTK